MGILFAKLARLKLFRSSYPHKQESHVKEMFVALVSSFLFFASSHANANEYNKLPDHAALKKALVEQESMIMEC